jgi:hypothetical protein
MLLICLMCFSYACSKSSEAESGGMDEGYYDNGRNSASDSDGAFGASSAPPIGDYDLAPESAGSGGYDNASNLESGTSDPSGAQTDPERKEIQNGSVRIVVDDVAAAYDKISALIDSLDGYEFSKSKNNSEADISIYVTVKIPPNKLGDFETGLSDAVGKDAVHQYALSSEDITAQYYDSKTRLETMRISLSKYQEFLGTAQTVEEILLIQREISNLQTQIDVAEGQIRLWDRLIEYATLDISISSKVTPLQTSWKFESSSDVFKTIQDGFTATADGAGNVLLWILVVLASAMPVLIPLAIILFILIFLLRKRKKKKLARRAGMLSVTGSGMNSGYGSASPTGFGLNGSAQSPRAPSAGAGQLPHAGSTPSEPAQDLAASGFASEQSPPIGTIPSGSIQGSASTQTSPSGAIPSGSTQGSAASGATPRTDQDQSTGVPAPEASKSATDPTQGRT